MSGKASHKRHTPLNQTRLTDLSSAKTSAFCENFAGEILTLEGTVIMAEARGAKGEIASRIKEITAKIDAIPNAHNNLERTGLPQLVKKLKPLHRMRPGYFIEPAQKTILADFRNAIDGPDGVFMRFVHALEQHAEHHKAEAEVVRGERDRAIAELQSRDTVIQPTQDSLNQNLQNKLDEAVRARENAEAQHGSLFNQLKGLIDGVSEQATRFEEARKAQQTRDEETRFRISRLEDDLRAAKDKASEEERRSKDSEQGRAHAEDNLRVQIDNNARQAETITTTKEELRDIKSNLENLSNDLKSSREETENVQGRLEELETDLETSRGETRGAREQLETLQTALESSRQDTRKAREELEEGIECVREKNTSRSGLGRELDEPRAPLQDAERDDVDMGDQTDDVHVSYFEQDYTAENSLEQVSNAVSPEGISRVNIRATAAEASRQAHEVRITNNVPSKRTKIGQGVTGPALKRAKSIGVPGSFSRQESTAHSETQPSGTQLAPLYTRETAAVQAYDPDIGRPQLFQHSKCKEVNVWEMAVTGKIHVIEAMDDMPDDLIVQINSTIQDCLSKRPDMFEKNAKACIYCWAHTTACRDCIEETDNVACKTCTHAGRLCIRRLEDVTSLDVVPLASALRGDSLPSDMTYWIQAVKGWKGTKGIFK